MDIVARVPAGASFETDTTVEQLTIRVAGSAANCAIAAAAAGAAVEAMGVLGGDAFGGMILKRLSEAGVGTSLIRQNVGQTGVVISQVRPDGERTFLSYRGANATRYGELTTGLVSERDYIYLSGYSLQDEASAEMAHALKESAGKSVFDPTYLFARDFQQRHKDHLAGVHMVTPNLEEAQLMTGLTEPEECARALKSLGVAMAVVKAGARGCFVLGEGKGQWVATQPATGKPDTTGAGDAFCGTLIASCLQGLEVVAAAEKANEAARRVVCC